MFGRRKKVQATAGDPAPAFRLAGLDGTARSLDDILAGGPALLAFFKISCPVCQLTAPYLERLAANKAIQVIGISQDDTGATREFMQRFGVSFPTLLDSSKEGYPASNAYGIVSVPSLFLLERDGVIARAFSGFSRRDFEEIGARAGISPFGPDDHVPEWKAG
jgi:cytochrome c biogenesis protein CcmG/thiol:disulfide interchange protein DsbE